MIIWDREHAGWWSGREEDVRDDDGRTASKRTKILWAGGGGNSEQG